MIRNEDVFHIGVLGKTHGVKGEINFSFDDDVFDRVNAEYIVLELDGIMVPFFIEEYRFRSNERVLLKLEGIDDEEQARRFVGVNVFFPYDLADKSRQEMFSLEDFIGYEIKNVGRIEDIDASTENILFEVKKGKQKVLIPVVEEWIENVDHSSKCLTMNIPQGLMEI